MSTEIQPQDTLKTIIQDNTEIVRINATYHFLTKGKKLEILSLIQDWIDDEFTSLAT